MSKRITFNGETATLIGDKTGDPPIREVRRQIIIELGTIIRSVKTINGEIDDPRDLYEIACLRKALKLLPKR